MTDSRDLGWTTLAAAGLAVLASSAAPARAGSTERVSVSSSGGQGNGDSGTHRADEGNGGRSDKECEHHRADRHFVHVHEQADERRGDDQWQTRSHPMCKAFDEHGQHKRVFLHEYEV